MQRKRIGVGMLATIVLVTGAAGTAAQQGAATDTAPRYTLGPLARPPSPNGRTTTTGW